MKIENCKLKIICLLVLVVLVVFPKKASASQLSLVVSPPTASHVLNPGEKVESIIKIRNEGNKSLTISASLYDFIVEDTIGTPHLLPPSTFNNRFSASSWITLSPSAFTLTAHQTQEVRYMVKPPLDARPGGHYAALLFTPMGKAGLTSSGAAVEPNIGALLLVTLTGQVYEEAQVVQFSIRSFQEYGPLKVLTRIKNNGDLHIKPRGKIVLFDIFGRTVEEQSLTENNIFPKASRDYQANFGKKFMFGRFKVYLKASYGSTNFPLTASAYVWIIPLQIVTILLLVIIALILGVMLWKRKQLISNEPPMM